MNKIGFSALAAASLMHILKKQRDAVGLSVYSNNYDYYAPAKGSDSTIRMLARPAKSISCFNQTSTTTKTYEYLASNCRKIHRRSLIFLFTDMFEPGTDDEKLFECSQTFKISINMK